jgi:S-formylglutathione hydrolase
MSGAWSAVEIAGKPADVFDPPDGPRFGIIDLHDQDARTLRDDHAFTSLLAVLRLGCVCPHGKQAWWADRLCPDFDPALTAERWVVEHVLPFTRQRWQLGPRSVGIMGAGMGGQGALRLALKHPDLFPVVAGLSPALEYHELYGRGTPLDDMYDSKEQCRQDTAILHVHPSHYPPHLFFCVALDDLDWHRGADRLHEKLAALGIPHACDLTTRAGGQRRAYNERMAGQAVGFLDAGLEVEGRRLL